MRLLLVLGFICYASGRQIDWQNFNEEEARALVANAIENFKRNTTVLNNSFDGPDYMYQVGGYYSKTWAETVKTVVTGYESAYLSHFSYKTGFMWRHNIDFQITMPSLMAAGNLILTNVTYDRGPPEFKETAGVAIIAMGQPVFNVSITANHVYKSIEIGDVNMERDYKYEAKLNCNDKTPEWMCKAAHKGLIRELNAKRCFPDRNMMSQLFDFFDRGSVYKD